MLPAAGQNHTIIGLAPPGRDRGGGCNRPRPRGQTNRASGGGWAERTAVASWTAILPVSHLYIGHYCQDHATPHPGGPAKPTSAGRGTRSSCRHPCRRSPSNRPPRSGPGSASPVGVGLQAGGPIFPSPTAMGTAPSGSQDVGGQDQEIPIGDLLKPLLAARGLTHVTHRSLADEQGSDLCVSFANTAPITRPSPRSPRRGPPAGRARGPPTA